MTATQPIYRIVTSGKTGKTYRLQFDNDPTDDDIDEGVSVADREGWKEYTEVAKPSTSAAPTPTAAPKQGSTASYEFGKKGFYYDKKGDLCGVGDCSAYVATVAKKAGASIPTSTANMLESIHAGKIAAGDVNHLKDGDFVVVASPGSDSKRHVGIFHGGFIYDAPGGGKQVGRKLPAAKWISQYPSVLGVGSPQYAVTSTKAAAPPVDPSKVKGGTEFFQAYMKDPNAALAEQNKALGALPIKPHPTVQYKAKGAMATGRALIQERAGQDARRARLIAKKNALSRELSNLNENDRSAPRKMQQIDEIDGELARIDKRQVDIAHSLDSLPGRTDLAAPLPPLSPETFWQYDKRAADASDARKQLAQQTSKAQMNAAKAPTEANKARYRELKTRLDETDKLISDIRWSMGEFTNQYQRGAQFEGAFEHATRLEQQQKQKRFDEMGLLGKAANALSSGFGSVIEGGLGAADFVGKQLGADTSTVRGMADIIHEDVSHFSNPNPALWEQVINGIGSQGPSWMLGFGASSLAQGLAKIAPRVAAWIGASIGGVSEAATNAGSTYENVLRSTGDENSARWSAGLQFSVEAIPNVVLDRLGLFDEARGIKAAFLKATPEAFQEGYQQAIQNIAQGEPWDEGIGENALVGGLTALMFTVPAGVAQRAEDGRHDRNYLRSQVRNVAERFAEHAEAQGIDTPQQQPEAVAADVTVQEPNHTKAAEDVTVPRQSAGAATELHDAAGRTFTETRVNPNDIGVKPGLQFKTSEVSDEANAVSDQLKGVEKYDQAIAGPLTVWETKDGQLWVVNGHHRRELAIRTGEESVPVRVYKESEGVDFETARALGALQNLMDGKGRALDVATALKRGLIDEASMKNAGVSPRMALVKDALGLMKLSENSLDMVRNGEIPDAVAGAIGAAKLSAEREGAAMREAKRSGLETRRQGEILAEKTKTAQLTQRGADDGQGDIFGELQEDLPFGEMARIEESVERALVRDKRLFAAMTKGKAAGTTKVDAEAQSGEAAVADFAKRVIGTSAEVQQAIEREAIAYAKNPTRKRLNEATDRIADIARREAGRVTRELGGKTAARNEAVREPLQSADTGRKGSSKGGRRSAGPRSRKPGAGSSERADVNESRSLGEIIETEYSKEISRMEVDHPTKLDWSVTSPDLPGARMNITRAGQVFHVTLQSPSKTASPKTREIGTTNTAEEAKLLAKHRLAPIVRAGGLEAFEAPEPTTSRTELENQRQQLEKEMGREVWLKVGDNHYWTGTGFVSIAEGLRNADHVSLQPFNENAGVQQTMLEEQGTLFSKGPNAEQSKDAFEEAAQPSDPSTEAPSRGQAFKNTRALSLEAFKDRLDAIIKIAKSGGANVFMDLDDRNEAAAHFQNPTKKFRHGRIRAKDKFSPAQLAEILAHEVGHQIDSIVTGASINEKTGKPERQRTSGKVEVLFGVDKETAKVISEELAKVTIFLEGSEVVAKDQGYFSSPVEQFARFMQAVMFHPNLVEELAPTAFDALVAQSQRFPQITDFLTVAEGGMLEYDSGYMFLPDSRQSYIKALGRYLGTKAYDNEVRYRTQRARALAETTQLINEKFKGVKDDQEILFNAAEGIVVTQNGVPQFGTKVRDMLQLPEGIDLDALAAGQRPEDIDEKAVKKLLAEHDARIAAGYTAVGVTDDNRVIYEKWRKTPEEAKMAYNALSEEGKALIREYTADAAEAKDAFNRNVQKATYDIESDIEGYVHHFGFDDKQINTWRRLFMVERKAAAAKRRTGREGYTKDFRRAVTKAMAELQIASEYNKFINKQLALVAKPLGEDEHPDPGWREVEGNLISGIDLPGARRIIVDGHKITPGKRYQVPLDVYNKYLDARAFTEEMNTAREMVKKLNRYWQGNMLLHPGTAMTNFFSGALQFGGKMSTDFWMDVFERDFTRTKANVVGALETLTPAGWKAAPDWVFGGDQSNFYAQFRSDKDNAANPDGILNKALAGYMAIERFWKKVIVNSEKRASEMENPFDDPDFIAHVNAVVDAYAYDYANVPAWLSGLRSSAAGAAVKPFATYPYKYTKMLTYMAGGIFDKNLSTQERFAKMMGLATMLFAVAMFRKWRDDDDEHIVGKLPQDLPETFDEQKLEANVGTRGRLYVAKDSEGNEVFMRTAKYPFLDVMDFASAVANLDSKGAFAILKDKLGSVGPIADALLTVGNYTDEFNRYKPMSAHISEIASTFIPGSRILKDTGELIDPHSREFARTPGQVLGQYIPWPSDQLPKWMQREVRTVRVPLDQRRGRFTTETVEVPKYRQDVFAKMFLGINLRRVNPDWYRRYVNRGAKNAIKNEATAAGESTASERSRKPSSSAPGGTSRRRGASSAP